MAAGAELRKPRRKIRSRRDWGRTFARLVCLVFALIGAVPLTGGLLLRSQPLKQWAAGETSRLLRMELGVEATFAVEMSLVPLRLAITDLQIAANDRPEPAVSASVIAVSPRFFSLLAGRIDVGDIELEDTNIRLVVEEGEVKNVAYRFPETETDSPDLKRSPFRSLAISNAALELTVDGTLVKTQGIDIDAIAEKDLTFDIALQTAGATITSTHPVPAKIDDDESTESASATPATTTLAPAATSYDEDRVCALDLRVFASKDEYIIRRLSLLGVLDSDAKPNTLPSCGSAGADQVALRLSQLKIRPQEDGAPEVRGHIMARAPLALMNRFGALEGRGWAGFSGNVSYDGTSRLPEVTGQLTGEGLWLDEYSLSEKLQAELLISGDVVQLPTLVAEWGNGRAALTGVKLKPFEDKFPLEIQRIKAKGVDFPGVMRDIGMTEHSWVDWNFGNTEVHQVRGTLDPFYIDGGINAHTHDYVVWDRGFDDPARVRMFGIEKARVTGRFRAHSEALEFYGTDLKFGSSHLPVELVSVGFFEKPLIVRLKEGGGNIDLADVSPIANLNLEGQSKIFVDMNGPMEHPILKGTLSVDDLVIGGFKAGDIQESKVHFEPLFVDFLDLKGQKGAMDYHLPNARLNFDGPASVEFETSVSSKNFHLQEFLDVFEFDEDPRFADLRGNGQLNAQVRYLLGGPEDTCGEGRLSVGGRVNLKEATLLDEKYSGGNGEFSLSWFDIEAGLRGMRAEVPSLTLKKGSGTVFGSLRIAPGGNLQGDIIGTRIPVSRIDALNELLGQADGFVTGSGRLGGSLERLSVDADIQITELESGDARLGPSTLNVALTSTDETPASSGLISGCGRPIPAISTEADYLKDESDGEFVLNGQLFGGQVELSDLRISRQRAKEIRGQAHLEKLSVGSLLAFSAADAAGAPNLDGTVSGDLSIEEFFVARPFDSSLNFKLSRSDFELEELSVELADPRATIRLQDKQIFTEHLALEAKTGAGQRGVLDGELSINEQGLIDASLDLRPTTLGVLAPALPGVERAEGRLTASFGLNGPFADPQLTGFIEVEDGKIALADYPAPLSDLQLTIAMDQTGLHIAEGRANWGGGKLQLRGDTPLVRGQFARTDLLISARDVTLPIEEGLDVSFDADLKLAVPPPSDETKALPALSGQVNVLSGRYEKRMSVTADISSLTGRGEKTEITGYDASKDSLKLDVLLTSSQPLEVKNELVEATLSIDRAGLRVSGTNQQFGAVGTVEINKGGQVFLRRNEFEVQGGLVRFNDPTRLRPEVDVTAVTEYRRSTEGGAAGGTTSANDSGSGAPGAGNWRILMHAYGAPENLKVDLTSNPPLAQDDIFLLLAVGLTRTELDQTSSSGVGSSVALEALGSLSGAESAVTKTVPVDEFRFGSTYSARSGRTEPTVTIGKRLSQRIRASVTTSLSESSEVRSNVEYRATENLSVQGAYDNAGNVGSATGGNLGGDIRWRLEFK